MSARRRAPASGIAGRHRRSPFVPAGRHGERRPWARLRARRDPFRVFQFALTTDAQRQALAALRSHLRPEARVVLDLFDPRLDYVIPRAEEPPRGGELIHPVTGNRVTWDVSARWPDPARQLITEDWTFREWHASGEVLRTDVERLTLRWSLRSEMRLLLELAGLDVVAEYGDFSGGPPAYGREQVWVLTKG